MTARPGITRAPGIRPDNTDMPSLHADRPTDATSTVGTSAPRPAGRVAILGRRHRDAGVALGALLAVTCVVVLSVLIGAAAISPAALFSTADPGHAVALARVDRTLLGLAVGAALGLAGALMQGLTRNPLADPGLLGINAGACLTMAAAMSWFDVTSIDTRIWAAFVGAALAGLLVHGIASLGRDGATPVKIAVAGAAVTAALTSLTSATLLTDQATMQSFRTWQVGSVNGRGEGVLLSALPFLAVGFVLAMVGARLLDALALGDDVARGLGRRTGVDRTVIWAAVVLLTGSAVALAGPLAFVGLLVPHAARALVGPDHLRLLPLSAVGGALLVVLADTAGRVVLPPGEVQAGIMVAVVGVPFFLLLIRRGRLGAL